MKTSKGLLFFYDWGTAFENLSGDDCKTLLLSMLAYSRDNTEPPELTGGAAMAASFIFPAIRRSKINAESGSRGGQTKAQNVERQKVAVSTANSDANGEVLPQDETKQNETITKQNNTSQNETLQNLFTPCAEESAAAERLIERIEKRCDKIFGRSEDANDESWEARLRRADRARIEKARDEIAYSRRQKEFNELWDIYPVKCSKLAFLNAWHFYEPEESESKAMKEELNRRLESGEWSEDGENVPTAAEFMDEMMAKLRGEEDGEDSEPFGKADGE